MKTTSISIWYGERGLWGYELLSGTCSVRGEGSLGYEPHSKRVRYGERGLWGTNYTLEHVRYGEMGLWGTNYSPERVCGRERGLWGYELLSGTCVVRGEGPLMYGMLHKTPLV